MNTLSGDEQRINIPNYIIFGSDEMVVDSGSFDKFIIDNGFNVLGKYNLGVYLGLPDGWTYSKITDYEDCILDNEGRPRLLIEHKRRQVKILPYYSYRIIVDYTYDKDRKTVEPTDIMMKIISINCDNITCLESISLNDLINFKAYSYNINANRGANFMNSLKIHAEGIMNVKYPNWKNPLKYWK